MSGFADELAPALSSTLQRVQTPPPPPPKGTFADGLAAAFGGGPDIQGAYGAGLEQRSKFNAQSAQTLSALAEAEKRRTEALRQSQINDLISKAQSNPDYAPSVSDMLTIATGANDFSNARLGMQEYGNRGILGDPNAAPTAQFAAGQGVQGKVLPRIETAGGQNYNMATDPNMQAPTMTPLQQAQVNAEKALEYQRMHPTTGAASGAPVLRSSGGVTFQQDPVTKQWSPIASGADLAAAAAAKAAGTATGQKQAALYANLNNIDAFTGTIDEFLQHPGFKTVYGLSSIADPRNFVPGTDAQGAKALREQLNSRSFLVSIQAMRGMGQLSNQEGAKVETALTAALKPGLNDEEAALRLGELKQAVQNLRNVAVQEANATENALTPPAAMGSPPAQAGGNVMRSTSKSGKPIISNDGGATWVYE